MNIGPAGLVLKFSYLFFLLFPLICLYILLPRIPQLYILTLLLKFPFFFIFNFSKLSCDLNVSLFKHSVIS